MAKALFKSDNAELPVQFNPETLSVTHTRRGEPGFQRPENCEPGGSTDEKAGRSAIATGYSKSLTVDLIFDTSDTDENVRNQTGVLLSMMQPCENQSQVVVFEWGTFTFKGNITNIAETLNYFSEQGKPLRAQVNVSMTGADADRAANSITGANAGLGISASASLGASIGASAGVSAGASAGFSAGASASLGAGVSAGLAAGGSIGTTPLTFSQGDESLQSLAGRAGLDWKAVAKANDIDDPRSIQAGAVINLNIK